MMLSPGLRMVLNLPQRSTILTVPVSTVVQQHDMALRFGVYEARGGRRGVCTE